MIGSSYALRHCLWTQTQSPQPHKTSSSDSVSHCSMGSKSKNVEDDRTSSTICANMCALAFMLAFFVSRLQSWGGLADNSGLPRLQRCRWWRLLQPRLSSRCLSPRPAFWYVNCLRDRSPEMHGPFWIESLATRPLLRSNLAPSAFVAIHLVALCEPP